MGKKSKSKRGNKIWILCVVILGVMLAYLGYSNNFGIEEKATDTGTITEATPTGGDEN